MFSLESCGTQFLTSSFSSNFVAAVILPEGDQRVFTLPEQIRDVLKCKNPRCITSVEQELPHVFKLTDRDRAVYRCIYCETKAGG